MNQETLKKYDLGKGLVVEVGNRPKAARTPVTSVLTLNNNGNQIANSSTANHQLQAQNDIRQLPSNPPVPESHNVQNPAVIAKPDEPKLVPPPITEEDLIIFRQFMDVPVKREMLDCPICKRSVDFEHEGYQLSCEHTFCKLCLTDEIKNNFDNMGQVKCPMENCLRLIDDEETQIILGDEFPQHLDKITKLIQENIDKMRSDQIIAEELEIENMIFIENRIEFECTICFNLIPPGGGIKIKACRHEFCKECLSEHIKQCEDAQVQCPHTDENGNCVKIIEEREMRGFVSEEVLAVHHRQSLKLFEGNSNTFHCKTPDCVGFVEIDDQVQGFQCQICYEVNCVRCKVIHTGKTCQEYHDEIDPQGARNREITVTENALREMVENGEAMYCPNCRIPVMKSSGCDYIVCSACKLDICWITRKPRKPLTRKDGVFIDGCHCRENGVLCHPRCGNCH